MVKFGSEGLKKIFHIAIISVWWLWVAIAVIRIQNPMWKEILTYSFLFPILFVSYFGKVAGLILSVLSSIVSASQALNEFLILSPFAQRILFQILFINSVALVTTSLSEREEKAKLTYQQLFSNVPIGLFRVNSEGNFIKINPALAQIFEIDGINNPGIYNLKDFFLNSDEFIELLKITNENRITKNLQVMLRRKDGKTFWGQINCHLTENNEEFYRMKEYEGSLEDISERVTLYEEVKSLATYDSLTGIFNRGHLLVLANRIFRQALNSRRPLSMLLFDIDFFKTINDTYGHPAGDTVLKEVAECTVKNTRSTDIVGRYGGDEFVVFLPEQEHRDALATAKRLSECIQALSIFWGRNKISVSVSIGIVHLDFENDRNVDDLIRRADAAMYQTKRASRNHVTG